MCIDRAPSRDFSSSWKQLQVKETVGANRGIKQRNNVTEKQASRTLQHFHSWRDGKPWFRIYMQTGSRSNLHNQDYFFRVLVVFYIRTILISSDFRWAIQQSRACSTTYSNNGQFESLYLGPATAIAKITSCLINIREENAI